MQMIDCNFGVYLKKCKVSSLRTYGLQQFKSFTFVNSICSGVYPQFFIDSA